MTPLISTWKLTLIVNLKFWDYKTNQLPYLHAKLNESSDDLPHGLETQNLTPLTIKVKLLECNQVHHITKPNQFSHLKCTSLPALSKRTNLVKKN